MDRPEERHTHLPLTASPGKPIFRMADRPATVSPRSAARQHRVRDASTFSGRKALASPPSVRETPACLLVRHAPEAPAPPSRVHRKSESALQLFGIEAFPYRGRHGAVRVRQLSQSKTIDQQATDEDINV